MFFPESFKMEETFFHFFPFLYHPQDYSSTAPPFEIFLRYALCALLFYPSRSHALRFLFCSLPPAYCSVRFAPCAMRFALIAPCPTFLSYFAFSKNMVYKVLILPKDGRKNALISSSKTKDVILFSLSLFSFPFCLLQ